MYWTSFFLGTLLAAQGGLQLVDRAPTPKLAPGPSYAESFDAALAFAKEKQRRLLLFFTASWCGPCHEMELETLRAPAVLTALAEFEVVKIDVEAQATRDLCRHWHADAGVPAFVVVDAAGSERLRWSGYLEPQPFLERLLRAQQTKQPQIDPESTLYEECLTAHSEAKWQLLEQATSKFVVTFPDAPRRGEIELLHDIAAFELGGELSALLSQRIDRLIRMLHEPFPGDGIAHRLRRLLGQQPTADHLKACTAWVDRINASVAALRDLGRPARARLIQELLTKDGDGGRRAGTALMRMRLVDTPAMLLDRITDASLSARIRSHVVACVRWHGDARTLAPLMARLADVDEHVEVRSASARAIHYIVSGAGGTARTDIAKVLECGLRSSHASLREECLQALFAVRAPVDLELLYELLSDRRPLFMGYEMRDNALWILLQQLNKVIVDEGGQDIGERCTDEMVTFLRADYASKRDRLHWDEDRECYVLR